MRFGHEGHMTNSMTPISHYGAYDHGQTSSDRERSLEPDHQASMAPENLKDQIGPQFIVTVANSLGLTQHSYDIFRAWVWEILSIWFAIGLLSAIAALLISFNGHLPPDWGANINLNAVLALLSTVFRAMLVIVVSQIISQRKWDWYHNDRLRPLADLQRFDTGSRGVLGAVSLVPRVLRRDLIALFAAIILLASFLVGPFVQQASRTISCSHQALGMAASLPYAHFVPRTDGYTNKDGPTQPTTDTRVTLLSSATAADGVENRITATCATGNCTFPGGDPIDDNGTNNLGLSSDNSTSHSTVALCNKCADITSLVSTSSSEFGHMYSLPNGFNISDYIPDFRTVLISPATDLEWLGDKFTSELRTISRWAFSNVTFLTLTPQECRTSGQLSCPGAYQAALCVLYPCLQSYVASVINGELSEELIQSSPMQPNLMPDADDSYSSVESNLEIIQRVSGYDNDQLHYTSVKSPCQVDEATYDLQNMSSYPATTNLSLFTTDPGSSGVRNLSAPEACIYRHHAKFGKAVTTVFEADLFAGTCNQYRSFTCLPTSESVWGGLGSIKVLETLYNNGSANFSLTNNWFESFAKAVSNRYRFQFGSSIYNESATDLPVGEIQGVAWQASTCVLMQEQWLALPAGLAFAAAILFVWTIASSWRHRHTRPVWKDNILPMLLYSDRLELKDPQILTRHLDRDDLIKDGTCLEEHDNVLLETTEMEKIAGRTLVKFRWPENAERQSVVGDDSAALAGRQEKWWVLRRKPRQFDTDSLLERWEN
ncbi:hypothetical protein Hte_006915 [Hypoxylon texense]